MPSIPTARRRCAKSCWASTFRRSNNPNASREARVGVEIRNALAFKLYGNATGVPPLYKLVIRLTTSRSSLIVDPNTGLPTIENYGIDVAIQPDRDRDQQIGHDRHHVLARLLRYPGQLSALRPRPRLPRRRGSRRQEIADNIQTRLASFFYAGT